MTSSLGVALFNSMKVGATSSSGVAFFISILVHSMKVGVTSSSGVALFNSMKVGVTSSLAVTFFIPIYGAITSPCWGECKVMNPTYNRTHYMFSDKISQQHEVKAGDEGGMRTRGCADR